MRNYPSSGLPPGLKSSICAGFIVTLTALIVWTVGPTTLFIQTTDGQTADNRPTDVRLYAPVLPVHVRQAL